MAAAKRQALRMPGRVFERLLEIGQERLDDTSRPPIPRKLDAEICDALTRAKLKPRGYGWTVLVPLEIPDVERLVKWIQPEHPKFLRDYAEQVRKAVEQHRQQKAKEEDECPSKQSR